MEPSPAIAKIVDAAKLQQAASLVLTLANPYQIKSGVDGGRFTFKPGNGPSGASIEGKTTTEDPSPGEHGKRNPDGSIAKGSDGRSGATPADIVDAKRRGKVIEELNRSYGKMFDTQTAFATVDSNGKVTYSEDRQRLHQQIVDDFVERAKSVPHDGRVLVLGGLPGAGKSTARGTLDFDSVTIDPDEIKSTLLDNSVIPKKLKKWEAAALVHEESSYVSSKVAHALSATRANVTLDITMSTERSVKTRLAEFQEDGYKVKGAFVDVSIETSKTRVIARFADLAGTKEGGRYVPEHVVDAQAPSSGSKYQSKNRETFETLKAAGVFTEGASLFDGGV